MDKFWIGICVTEGGSLRDHSRLLSSKEEAGRWCANVLASKSSNFKAIVMEATDMIVLKETPIEYISLSEKEKKPELVEVIMDAKPDCQPPILINSEESLDRVSMAESQTQTIAP